MATQAIAGQAGVQGIKTPPMRLFYIDNLRVLLSVLVVLHHLAITYGAEGDWYFEDVGTSSLVSTILLSMFTIINQSFFMGLFFMLSGFFGASSCDRKGEARFLQDRLIRLGIPFLFYAVAINPLLNFWLASYRGRFAGNFLEFIPYYLARQNSIGDGPVWFLGALLVFSFVYVAGRLVTKPVPEMLASDGPSAVRVPGNMAIAVLALCTAIGTFLVRLVFPAGYWLEPMHWQLAHWVQYITLFTLGIVAYRRNWFSSLSPALAKPWVWAIVLLIPVFPVIAIASGALEKGLGTFMGGLNWQAFAAAIWEQFMCVALIVTLLVLFRDRLNYQGKLAKAMSASAYAVFVFFAPVIVLLALALRGIQLELGLKFILIAPLAVLASFAVGYIVRQLPLARNIL